MNEIQKKNRIIFVKKNINMDWKKVFFRMKKIQLTRPDSYFKYWGHGKTEKRLINRNKFNGGGIMVHLTTSYNVLISMLEMQEKSD